MKTTIYGSKLVPELLRVTYYISPKWGPPRPYTIPKNRLVMEWLSVGPVVHPATGVLCNAGTIFLHQTGQTTISRTPPDNHYECMALEFRVVDPACLKSLPRDLFWPEEEGSLAFIKEMIHSRHHRRIPREILGPLIWSQVQYRIARTRDQNRNIPPRIAKCLREIEQKYADAFSIVALAAEVGLSPSHFHARFREVMGMTPYQYLVQQRMRAARHLLVTTSDPVKAIAFDVGYANTENFSRAFKKEAGMTAAQFRKANQTFVLD